VPVVVLAGEEDFLLERRVEELKKQLLDPDWFSFNFQRLVSPDLRQVVEAAASLPFGPGKRLVLVDRCDLFTKKRSRVDQEDKPSDKAAKELIEEFDRALPAVSPDTYLVFACPHNFDSTLRTSKVVSKYAELTEFPRAKYFPGSESRNPSLDTWCRKEAKRFGATIDDAAVTYLLDSTEADLRQVSHEIEKAATYLLPETHITRDVVAHLSPHHSHIFVMLDHWAHGRKQQAFAALDELLSRQSGMPIIAAVETMLSKWVRLRAAAERIVASLPSGPGLKRKELPQKELARRLSAELGLNAWVVEKDLERTGGLTARFLSERKVRLCELEYMVKTGQMPDRHALTIFLADQ